MSREISTGQSGQDLRRLGGIFAHVIVMDWAIDVHKANSFLRCQKSFSSINECASLRDIIIIVLATDVSEYPTFTLRVLGQGFRKWAYNWDY